MSTADAPKEPITNTNSVVSRYWLNRANKNIARVAWKRDSTLDLKCDLANGFTCASLPLHLWRYSAHAPRGLLVLVSNLCAANKISCFYRTAFQVHSNREQKQQQCLR